LLKQPVMVKTTIAVCVASALAGCATAPEPGSDDAEEPTNPSDDMAPPLAPEVVIDWELAAVELIALQDNEYLVDTAAVQLRLAGTFEADGGTEVAIGVAAEHRNGHPRNNYGSWSWDEPAINSDDFTSGWCGSFETIRTSRGLICRAPGDPGARQRTTWYYRQLERFEVTTEGVSQFDFYVTAYVGSDEILCNRILVSRSGYDASSTTAFPDCR
jgi:hypothetical protein